MHPRPITHRNVALICGVIVMKVCRHVSPIIKLRCKLENGQTARIKTETPGTIENIFRACLSARAPHSPCVFPRFFQRFTAPFQRERCNDPRPKEERSARLKKSTCRVSTVRRERGSMVDQSRSKEEHRYSLGKIIPQGCSQEKLLLLGGKKTDSIKFNFSL